MGSPESQSDYIQLMACTAVMAIIVISHLVTRPYEADSLDVLELLALFAVFITYLAALFFGTIDGFQPTKDKQWGEGGAGLLLTVLVVLAHAVFALYMIYLLILGTGHKLNTMRAKEHIERVKKTKNPRPWIRLSRTKDKKQLEVLKARVNPAAAGASTQPEGDVPVTPEQKEEKTDLEAAQVSEQTSNATAGENASTVEGTESHDLGTVYGKNDKLELDGAGNIRWRVGMAVECCCTIVPRDRMSATIRNPWLKGTVSRVYENGEVDVCI